MEMICVKCDKALVPKKTVFEYMKLSFSYDVMCCPSCGAAFIPEELADGKMAEVELLIEDK